MLLSEVNTAVSLGTLVFVLELEFTVASTLYSGLAVHINHQIVHGEIVT